MKLLSSLIGFLVLLLPQAAHAAISLGNVQDVVDSVGSGLPDFGGGGTAAQSANTLFMILVGQARPYVAIVAVIMIIYAGYRMVIGQDDNSKETAKHILTMSIVGIIMAYMINPFIKAFYGTEGALGSVFGSNPDAGVQVLNDEIMAIIDWVLFLVGILAVLMIVITGLKAIYSAGNEQGLTNLRNAIFAIAAGILLILLRFVLGRMFGYGQSIGAPNTPTEFVTVIVTIVEYILGFVTLAAVAVVIYAGILYLSSFGNEEQASKGKSLLIRSLIGLAVIILSYMIVAFVISVVPA